MRVTLTVAACVLLFCLAVLAGASIASAEEDDPALTPEVVATEPARAVVSARGGRDAVRDLAEQHFAPAVIPWVMSTAKCETGGTYDLYAHSSGFDRRLGVWYDFWGAMQVDAVTWAGKAWELFEGHLSDPNVSFAMAAWIHEHYGRGHWPVCGR